LNWSLSIRSALWDTDVEQYAWFKHDPLYEASAGGRTSDTRISGIGGMDSEPNDRLLSTVSERQEGCMISAVFEPKGDFG
jgi:hypothetical protein